MTNVRKLALTGTRLDLQVFGVPLIYARRQLQALVRQHVRRP
jgi:hypothetical protein